MNIAFAGFRHSHIFGLYNKALANEEVTVIGCYEEDAAERMSVGENKGIAFTYNTYEELLSDDRVEAIAIGDYYGKRGQMVIEALKHGKHVICDKPICTKLEELEEIDRLSSEKNLEVCCMLDLRYMAQVSEAKEIIESGELGEIHIVSFTGQHPLNYGKRPNWYFEEGKHGGTINDIAIHGMDLVRFLTGKNLTKVNFAKTWNAFAKEEPAFEDCGQFMAEMENVSLMADVSYAAPKCGFSMPTYWDFYFWGSQGMMNFRLNEKTIHVYKEKEEIIECAPVACDYLKAFINETKGIRTMMNTKDILESQRQVLKIQEAAQTSILNEAP